MSHLLLRCLGKALLKNGVKMLASAVPFGPILFDVASDTWEEYRKCRQELGLASNSAPDANLRREVEQLAPLSVAEATRLGEKIARDVAPQLPAEERAALAAYLGQVPAAVRRSLRRTADPSGKSVPADLRLQRPVDLLRFLPDRMPRFKPGERPIPGVDRELVELLGSGGFGEVWSARNPHKPSAPLVALKFCLDAQAAKSLHNEVRLLKRLEREGQHVGLVTLRAIYLTADPPCLEYEFVEGGDLSGLIGEWHAPGKQPDPKQVAYVILQLAETVGFVHSLNPPVVHRDLKPANILIQRHKRGGLVLKVADFGIGSLVAQQALRGVSNRPMTTRHDMTMALRGAFSPHYASPQQIAGQNPNPRDDVYALGIIWYQALLGDLTQGAPSGVTWAKNLRERGVNQGHCQLLMACFESDPAERPADAEALAVRLRNLLELKPGPWPKPRRDQTPPQARQKPNSGGWIATILGYVLISAGILGAALFPVAICMGGIYWFASAKSLDPDSPKTDDALVAKVKAVSGIDLVSIPNGSFLMGSPDNDKDAYDDEKPQHKVTISKPLFMGKYKVTVGQFKRFVEATGYKTEAEKANDSNTWKEPGFEQTDDHPVVYVSWNDADAYCQWLAKETGTKVRLPSEAEHEYCCRAVTEAKPTTKFYFGDNEADLNDFAWYRNNTNDKGTKPCGQKKTNAFGLYDMHGLTYECCVDGKRDYKKQDETDPVGAGESRVFRGGSFSEGPRNCRAANRFDRMPSFRVGYVGFIGFRVSVSR